MKLERGAVRGCLVALALYAVAAAILVAVALAWMGSGPREEPSPNLHPTIAPSYTRAPATFPPEVDDVLEREWNAGRHGCGITGPAVDDLAAALERDLEHTPRLDARALASQWVNERCRG